MYGANRSLLDLITGLRDHNVESLVVHPRGGRLAAELKRVGIASVTMPVKGWFGARSLESRLKKPARLLTNLAMTSLLYRHVKRWDPDIIYTNSSVTPLGAWTASAAKKPHVWHIRELPLLHYGLRYDWGERHFTHWLNKASAVVVISGAVREAVCGNIKPPTFVVYNGIACENDLLFTMAPKDPGPNYTFAIIGLTHPNKGQEEAIRALECVKEHIPAVRLLVVGSDSKGFIGKLKALANELGVAGHVEFWGYIEDPIRAYVEADAVLVCSRHEAMGRVTAEAMAAAKPVIGYRSGATPEIVDDKVTGLLYNGGYQDLAMCMRKIADNPDWARQMGIKGRLKARRQFTNEIYTTRIREVLGSVVPEAKQSVCKSL
jgi:glycosyltransferase involved in cell wall biosynthesis